MPPRTEYHREYRKAHREAGRKTMQEYRERQKSGLPPPVEPTPIERFEAKIAPITESGCWAWLGLLNHKGYAVMKVNGKNVLLHRWAYEHFVGPIPEGLEIDHKCAVKCCVNPAHLEPVTGLVNIRRRKERTGFHVTPKTHCPQGHEYTPENTMRCGKLGQYTMCRTCRNDKSKAYYIAHRARR